MNTSIGKVRMRKSLVIGLGKLIVCVGLSALNFTNKAAGDGPWDAIAQLTSTQGSNGWYYQQRPRGSTTGVVNMTYDGLWRTSDYPTGNSGWLGLYLGIDGHPGASLDVIRKWVAPSSGNVNITGRVYKIDTGGGGGVIASVEKNTVQIWCRTIAYNDSVGYTTDSDLGSVCVNSGDSLAFIVDDNGVYGYDSYGWDPVITKTASYDAIAQFTSTQGSNGWYYQQRPRGSMTGVVNMNYADGQWRTTDYLVGNWGWLGYYTNAGNPVMGHPGASLDVIRTWIAPSAGTVSVKGRVYKENTGGGAGVIASVEDQGTVKWCKTLAYNDATGYYTDADLANISVAASDAISFIVDDNGTYGFDAFAWDPVINFVSSTSDSWVLNTDDTLMTLAITGNHPTITNLEDAKSHYNWTPNPVTVPLLNLIYQGGTGGTRYVPNWSYTSATVETSSGTKVTLTFTSTTPSLILKQSWWARPGVGPVEEATTVTNNSGSDVTYNYIDVVATDLTVIADSTVTLWRFNRSSLGPGLGGPTSVDTGFATGVFKDALGTNAGIASTISNDDGTVSGNNFTGFLLPFIMLDVPGATQPHGLYIGYTCDFGNFSTTTRSNAWAVRSVFSLGNSGSFSQANTKTLNLPGMFVGTYIGDTDSGSNKMKKWFWDYKMTPTIKSTTNEPLLEASMPGTTESDAISLFANNPVVSWGFELVKEDAGWGDDQGGGPPFGFDWNLTSTAWPNGMTLGTIAHNIGEKLSLYMANTYNHADLSTDVGVGSEETALETRFNGNQIIDSHYWASRGYDYWRSDIDIEGHYNYSSHLGFIQVLDYMISNHSDFRWENCSSGGSKKSFDLLQRQSNQTTVDDGFNTKGEEHYREAYYANSYMINPVQLQLTGGSSEAVNTAGWHEYTIRAGFLGGYMSGTNDLEGDAALYKNTQRPILRGADVYHILRICDETHWDGIEFLNTAKTTNPKGSVVLFKPATSTTTSATFYLKGLIPTNTYTLTYQDRTGSNTSMSGAALMSGTGLTISGSANAYDSEIIWISW